MTNMTINNTLCICQNDVRHADVRTLSVLMQLRRMECNSRDAVKVYLFTRI